MWFFLFTLVVLSTCQVIYETNLFQSTGSGDFQCYRTPSIVQTPDKSLLVFVEGRKGSPNVTSCDLNSPQKSIVLRKSNDGRTWNDPIALFDCKCGHGNECGYPSVVVDHVKNITWLMFSGGEGTLVSKSNDNGETWTTPQVLNVDTYAKNPSVGHGIQLKSVCNKENEGRLVLPWVCGEHSKKREVASPYHSCLVFSDDFGNTWKLGAVAQEGSRESEVVQINLCSESNKGQTIYASERNFAGPKPFGFRLFAYSTDSGESFSKEGVDHHLIEPVTSEWTGVVASIATITSNGKEYILFSDPNNASSRSNLTIKASSDYGNNWSQGVIVNSGPSSYSDMMVLASNTIGIVYEQGTSTPYDNIKFAMVELDDILK